MDKSSKDFLQKHPNGSTINSCEGEFIVDGWKEERGAPLKICLKIPDTELFRILTVSEIKDLMNKKPRSVPIDLKTEEGLALATKNINENLIIHSDYLKNAKNK